MKVKYHIRACGDYQVDIENLPSIWVCPESMCIILGWLLYEKDEDYEELEILLEKPAKRAVQCEYIEEHNEIRFYGKDNEGNISCFLDYSTVLPEHVDIIDFHLKPVFWVTLAEIKSEQKN